MKDVSKVQSTGTLDALKVKGSGGENSGPTGSARCYPKGKKVSMTPDFNPQKCKGSTYSVGGV